MVTIRGLGLLALCLSPVACAATDPSLVVRARLTSLHGPTETACTTTVIGANDGRLVARFADHYKLQAHDHENLRVRLPVPAGGPYRITLRCIGSDRVFESESFSVSGGQTRDLGRIVF